MDKDIKKTMAGVYIVGGIVLFILFYIWLSGKIGLRATYDIKVYFSDITWLRRGDPVIIYGIEKGKVKSYHIEGDRVLVTLAIDKDVRLPEDSKIAIRLVNYLGSDRYIKIIPGKGDKIPEVYYGTDETLLFEAIAAKLDSITAVFDNLSLPDFNKLSFDIVHLLDENLRRLSESLKEPSEKVNELITRMDILFDSLTALTEKEGTVNKLIKSDELYQEILATNKALRELLEDIKANPERYIKIKVF
ncbi:MAG: MlaD family protein [candidate division WOR-3 bacterium]